MLMVNSQKGDACMDTWTETLREGSREKKTKVWALTIEGGAVTRNHNLIVKLIFSSDLLCVL